MKEHEILEIDGEKVDIELRGKRHLMNYRRKNNYRAIIFYSI